MDTKSFMDAAFATTDTEITLAIDAALFELADARPRYLIPGQKPPLFAIARTTGQGRSRA